MKILPNTITLVNLFLGCAAIVAAFEGLLAEAAIMILICSILDFMDGAVARWFDAGSEIGQQLDSLADLVSFGVAPASIMFHYLMVAGYTLNPESSLFVWPLLAFLIAVFSALRLAIFNVDPRQENDFQGMPTPANALLIASVPFVIEYVSPENAIHAMLVQLTSSFYAMLAIAIILSLLLVAPVRMFSLKTESLKWSQNRIRYIFLAGCVLLLITFGLAAAPLFLIFYIILSVIDNLWTIT